MPAWFNKGSTAGVLAVELFAPFLIIGPRRLRALAFGLIVGLQTLIALTGNYAFFNLLSAALCLFLLDDDVFGRAGPRADHGRPLRRLRHAALIAVAVVTVPVSALAFTSSVGIELPFWPLVAPVADVIAPLRRIGRQNGATEGGLWHCGLGIADCGLGRIRNRIRNPQSAIRDPQ